MPFVEKTTTAGNIKEIKRYFTSRFGKNIPRGPNEKPTPEQAEKINAKNRKDKMEQLVHSNFIGGKDYFATCTFTKFNKRRDWTKHPATTAEIEWIKSETAKYMRKLRDAYKNVGLELRYIKVVEVRDEDGVGVRPHIHFFMNKSNMDMIAQLWPHGRVTTSNLDTDYQSISELVSYFCKQKLEPEEKAILSKRWDQSRNLKKPEVEVCEIKSLSVARPPREVIGVEKGVKKYSGYQIIEWRNGYSDITGPWQYVKMIRGAP